ncbi:MAG: CoA-binding protein [Anaerolineae bacterium]
MLSLSELQEILLEAKTVAVYGMSRHPYKAAYQVPACLAAAGFEIIPINPFAGEIMGYPCYRSLHEVPGRVDIVDIFRPSAEVLPVVEEALARRAQRGDVMLIWLQAGIRSEKARRLAADADIPFVQNRCIAAELPLLLPEGIKRG